MARERSFYAQVEQFRFVSNWRDVYYRAHASDSVPFAT